MVENIRLSFQGIWSHKMRSFLTMLGIIIGIASIISIVSTIRGTNEQIKNNLIGAGNNVVTVQLYQGQFPYEVDYMGIPSGFSPVSDEVISMMEESPDVISATRYTMRNMYENVYYNNQSLSSSELYGIDENYLNTIGYNLVIGRTFSQSDYDNFRTVIVIDQNTASDLFPGVDPINKTIEINGIPFTIIGLIEEDQSFEPVINSIEDYYNYSTNQKSKLFIPSSVWPILFYFDEPENIALRATQTETMANAGKVATDLLNSHLQEDAEIKYNAQDLLQRAEELQALSNTTNSQLIWIASISLLVGGIGVMNIMLVSVTERTREIGLKKAIGAKKRKILWQFLTEAAVLSSLGGIIGVISGVILAEVISQITSAPVALDVPAIALAVIFSMLIGIIFGLLPSMKAAKLNPIDALRHE